MVTGTQQTLTPTPAVLGARYLGGSQCSFLVWAPRAHRIDVHVVSPVGRTEPLLPSSQGYFHGVISGVEPGARYRYVIDGGPEFPDPASRSQPEGVHGPSEVVDEHFQWTDANWRGIPIADYILYELHVGTFTAEGTLDAAASCLPYLADLGVTAVELMPLAEFPGCRNWGYDGVCPFAVASCYGGAAALKRYVDAAHRAGLAVVLDVVDNHLGPEGNYLGNYGPYFTTRYATPWGEAINFDGDHSAEVRRFFVENALQWTTEFHLDGLRLDAVHSIYDASPLHILREIADAVHKQAGNRHVCVTAESDLNDTALVELPERGGFGLDAMWSDDFHHSLHGLLTSERDGYYEDFGKLGDLAKAYEEGFVYSGQFSGYRGRRHGTASRHLSGQHFVVCSQNHDQIGNRAFGERLSTLLSREQIKLAAGAVLLSPFVPLLFMGEEYGETAPFIYFVSHSDPTLAEAVRTGRMREFAAFARAGELPDAQSEETFLRSKLSLELRHEREHRAILDLYRELIRLRKSNPALSDPRVDRRHVQCLDLPGVIALRRWSGEEQALLLLHFGHSIAEFQVELPAGQWRKLIDSEAPEWLGSGDILPPVLHSNGRALVTMSAPGFALYGARLPV